MDTRSPTFRVAADPNASAVTGAVGSVGKMSRSRSGWLLAAVALVIALVATAVVVGVRPNNSIPGSASATSTPGGGRSSADPAATLPNPPPVGSVPASGTEPAASGKPDGATGAESAGDPYYPAAGNGGYDVGAYRVALSFDPATNDLAATTTITATVTEAERLGRFSFDLQQTMSVASVTVNGAPAGFSRHDAKLVITPATGLDPGSAMTVIATYAGHPEPIAGGTSGLADGGWHKTSTGGAAVMGEPGSASAWYPANEHPTDRAAFSVVAFVPQGWNVISNGLPVTEGLPSPPAGYAAFGWGETSQMASYLTTLYIEKFTMTTKVGASGLTIINAYGPGAGRFADLGDKTDQYVSFLATKFGPYPFSSTGGIYMAEPVGFALETQTRPIYPGWVDEATVVHELAHQWFGDAVVVKTWADICLNECFASYAQWLWSESDRQEDLDQTYRDQIASYLTEPAFWEKPLVDMGPGNEFGDVYSRGPLALHALRAELGQAKFSQLLLTWVQQKSGKTAGWSDFEALVAEISGQDESGFLDAWFRKTGVPEDKYLWPGDLHK